MLFSILYRPNQVTALAGCIPSFVTVLTHSPFLYIFQIAPSLNTISFSDATSMSFQLQFLPLQ